jgi:hypothetical protein
MTFRSSAINKDIIKKKLKLPEKRSKDLIHEKLKCDREISETKRHYHEFIVSFMCLESSFCHIFMMHPNLVVTRSKIYLRKIFRNHKVHRVNHQLLGWDTYFSQFGHLIGDNQCINAKFYLSF